jgi:hypothetical protein
MPTPKKRKSEKAIHDLKIDLDIAQRKIALLERGLASIERSHTVLLKGVTEYIRKGDKRNADFDQKIADGLSNLQKRISFGGKN